MKKKLTAGGLALRLTLPGVLAILALTAAVQTLIFVRQEPLYELQGFEWLVDEEGVALAGGISRWLILAWCLLRCGRANTEYTLRRLGLRSWELTAVWAVVFTGYYLLSWGVQLLTVLGLYTMYAKVIPTEPIDLFIAAYRSRYFHGLLPLAETMTWLRSITLCLTMGGMTAMLARQLRLGGKPWMLLVLASAMLYLPIRMGKSATDAMLSLAFLACLVGQWLINREVAKNED